MLEPFRGNLVIATRDVAMQNEVLVGRKKRGEFSNSIVFPGGKIDFSIPGEWKHEGAARELQEETGVRRNPEQLRLIGKLFAWGERWAMIDIFHTDITGELPIETDELTPEWRSPQSPDFYEGMPVDVPHWFGAIQSREQFRFHTVWRAGQLASFEMEEPTDNTAFFRYMRLTDDKYFV